MRVSGFRLSGNSNRFSDRLAEFLIGSNPWVHRIFLRVNERPLDFVIVNNLEDGAAENTILGFSPVPDHHTCREFILTLQTNKGLAIHIDLAGVDFKFAAIEVDAAESGNLAGYYAQCR